MLKMSKPSTSVAKVVNRTFAYRNIKKDFQKPVKTESLVKQYHLERAEKGEVVIVEDRKCDFVELANKDVDSVGLANILALAAKGAVNLEDLRYDDSTAIDTSDLDPMNPQAVKDVVAASESNKQKLENIAKSLDLSVDELIGSLIDGTFSEKASAKLEKSNEGGKKDA